MTHIALARAVGHAHEFVCLSLLNFVSALLFALSSSIYYFLSHEVHDHSRHSRARSQRQRVSSLSFCPPPPLTPSQFSIAGLSSGCTGAFASFIIGELSSCLQVTSLLPVLNASGNNSAIDPLNRYLTSLCGSGTPICSNQSLAGAVTNVKGGCAAELEDKASIPSVILTVLEHYGPIRTAACSKNST